MIIRSNYCLQYDNRSMLEMVLSEMNKCKQSEAKMVLISRLFVQSLIVIYILGVAEINRLKMLIKESLHTILLFVYNIQDSTLR